jgi:hypothetical protein
VWLESPNHKVKSLVHYQLSSTNFVYTTELGAKIYGAELCYLDAIGYGAEQRVQK